MDFFLRDLKKDPQRKKNQLRLILFLRHSKTRMRCRSRWDWPSAKRKRKHCWTTQSKVLALLSRSLTRSSWRRFSVFKNAIKLSPFLKVSSRQFFKCWSFNSDLLKLVEVGVTVPPPRPPSPSSESESDSETDPDQRKERDTGIGSRETESSDIMDVMKRFMATLNS